MTRRLVRRLAAGGLAAAFIGAMAAAVPAHAAMPVATGVLTYVANGVTYNWDANGTSPTQFLYYSGSGAWSPDGSRYVYYQPTDSSSSSAKKGLYVVRPDGSAPLKLTDENVYDLRPVWSADGARILYGLGGTIKFAASDGSPWVGDLNENPDATRYSDNMPAVSPDNTIYFTRTDNSTGQTYLMRYGDSTPLISNAEEADFSPDGTKVAYRSTVDHQIYVANADGTGTATKVTNDSVGAGWPKWSPDGGSLLFLAARGATSDLQTVSPDGTNLTDLNVDADSAGWQPIRMNSVDRVWGQNAIGTGIAASQWNYADFGATNDPVRSPAKAVVLSRSDAFYDALVGSALAINKQAPLLITPPAALDSGVEAEIRRVLGTSGDVYLLGGTAALSSDVENRLKSLGYTTHRLAGANVFDTAIAIDKEILQGATPSIAVVATGMDYYDALAAGAAAGANPGTVIVLTNGDTMPTVSGNYLNTLNPDPNASNGTLIVTAGGPGDAALDEGFRAALMPTWPTTYQDNYVALNGANAMDTALLVAQFFFAAPQFAAVATFDGWYDALTGGAMIGAVGGPLLLTQPSGLYGPVADYLSQDAGGMWDTVILGGTAALPDSLESPLGEAISLPGEWRYNDYLATLGTTSTSRTLASPNRVYGPKLTRSTGTRRTRH